MGWSPITHDILLVPAMCDAHAVGAGGFCIARHYRCCGLDRHWRMHGFADV
jgi:hypothetical protein